MPPKKEESLRKERVARLFGITDFIDKARWEGPDTESLINYAAVNLSDDDKILVHWLCYITDRQTAYERIWDVGGFIFSQLVHDVKQRGTNILDPNSKLSYFIPTEKHQGFAKYKLKEKGYLFVSKIRVGNNQRLKDYDFSSDDLPFFISRYYPADYKAILNTLKVLKSYGFSVARFIKSVIERNIEDLDSKDSIRQLAFSLYLLTYYDTGQPKADDIDFRTFLSEATLRASKLESVLSNPKKFLSEFKSFLENDIYSQKRTWCALRDYLKSPEFSKCFSNALKEAGYKETGKLQSKEMLTQLELPGDVWNNNPKFRNCILKGTGHENSEERLNLLLRQIYEEEKPPVGYPEQFDISFDLAQRMCEPEECTICPYGVLNGEATEFKKVCIRHHGYYCPVILVSCGYKTECNPDNCEIIKAATETEDRSRSV